MTLWKNTLIELISTPLWLPLIFFFENWAKPAKPNMKHCLSLIHLFIPNNCTLLKYKKQIVFNRFLLNLTPSHWKRFCEEIGSRSRRGRVCVLSEQLYKSGRISPTLSTGQFSNLSQNQCYISRWTLWHIKFGAKTKTEALGVISRFRGWIS